MHKPEYDVNLFLVIFGSVLMIGAQRLTVFLDSFGMYYAFYALFTEESASFSIWGMAIRYGLALIIGFLIARAAQRNPIITAAACGFFGSVFMSWPVLLFWENFAGTGFVGQRVLVYLLFVVSMTYSCKVGAVVSEQIGRTEEAWIKKLLVVPVKDIAVAAFTALATTWLAATAFVANP